MKHMACNGISSSPFFPPNFMLQMQTTPQDHQEDHPTHTTTQLTPFLTSNQCTNPEDFIGVAAMLGGKRSSMSFSGIELGDEMNGEDDLSDDCSHVGQKKRRLNTEQVRALEKNFELGNKLEPERKMQLARALGLQPRQIAIWFQNRRARWKTKQLEKDYEMLKLRFEAIKAENDGLQSQNKKLQDEVLALRGREASELINLNKATEGSSSNRSENSSEINLDISRTSAPNESPLHHHQHLQYHQHHHHHNHESITFFPSVRPELHIPKAENSVAMEENFSNLLCGMEDQSAFWPWPDHQGFH